MSTKYLKKALDYYANTFQRFNKIPVEWDTKGQRLNFIEDFRPLRVWYFNVIVGAFFGMFCCTYGLLAKQILYPDGKIPLVKLIVLGALALLVLAGLLFLITMYRFGKEYVKGYNELLLLEKYLTHLECK